MSLVTSLPLVALAVVNPESAASVAEGRHKSSASPWNWLPPLLVTMLTTLPVLPPYSAEKALVEHRHLLATASSGQVGEDGLAAPAIVVGAAIHFEPGLPPAGAVGGEEVLVHEDVALIDGRAVGGVEQGQIGDAAVEQRRLLHLGGVEAGRPAAARRCAPRRQRR